MSPAELYEIYFMAQEAIDRLLQFLISISFAVVIAVFLASNKVNGFLYCVIGLIFSLVYIILGLRMNVAIEKVIEFQGRLQALGETFPQYPLLAPTSGVTGILIYLSTIGFLVYWYRKNKSP